MKVLQVSCGGLGNGGVQSVIMTICRNLYPGSCDIILLTNKKRYYDNEFTALGGSIFRIPKYEGKSKLVRKSAKIGYLFLLFFGTMRILKNNSYDVIHCHNEVESGICNLAAKIYRVKIRISHAHTSGKLTKKNGVLNYWYQTFLMRLTRETSNSFIGCSQEALVNTFGENVLKKSFRIIENPVDFLRFNIDDYIIKRTHNTIVHVGRFDENKNQIFLLPILKSIRIEIPDIKLILIGFGDEYERKIRNSIKQYDLEDNVEIYPSDSDIPSIFAKADLMIFPSKSEGFGIVLIEAQSMNVPCLVSDTVPRSVDCGLCKFFSLELSPVAWSQEALRMLAHNQKRIVDYKKLDRYRINNFMYSIKMMYQGIIRP